MRIVRCWASVCNTLLFPFPFPFYFNQRGDNHGFIFVFPHDPFRAFQPSRDNLFVPRKGLRLSPSQDSQGHLGQVTDVAPDDGFVHQVVLEERSENAACDQHLPSRKLLVRHLHDGRFQTVHCDQLRQDPEQMDERGIRTASC